ncbi:MAG: TIGR03915 family putative DNA repair protein [Clostridiales bacterium]|nr:TIGR03915 family putative DNA repair protein [Clostridiales bacterium]
MNVTYVTDGSFEGLLSAIHTMYYSNDKVIDILLNHPKQLDFSVNYKQIQTNTENAHTVYQAINQKISHQAAYIITLVWLSELPQCGSMIANFIKLGFNVGRRIDNMLTHKDVLPVHKASQKVTTEKHRMLGLCRFSMTERNFYLCEISPDYNILTLIAPHFASRMADQRWVIVDTQRNLNAIYNCEKWYIYPSKVLNKIPYSKDEIQCRALWKKYFDIIAIKGRTNPKLQKNMMPVRYWKNLTEFI